MPPAGLRLLGGKLFSHGQKYSFNLIHIEIIIFTIRKLMLIDPTILPLKFDKNHELDCVKVNLRQEPMN